MKLKEKMRGKPLSVLILIVVSLVFSVLLFSCGEKDPDAPEGYKTASNDMVDYYLYVPDDWLVDTGDNSLLVAARPDETGASNISMSVYVNDDDKYYNLAKAVYDDNGATGTVTDYDVIKAYWGEYKEDLASPFDTVKDENGGKVSSFSVITENDRLTVDSASAMKYVYTAKISGVDFQYIQVITLRDSKFYIFTYTTKTTAALDGDAYAENVSEIDGILENIKFK